MHGYGEMPNVEETLTSYLSRQSSSSARSPVLPTKPVRTTSALVGKAYSAAGQAAACLHTMSLLQAYKADLLADLDEGEGVGHLWLNLRNIKGKDKNFLMDAPFYLSGLFGDAVNSVVERFQE